MIHEFDLWSAPRAETNSFSDLAGTVVAIEASFYLNRLLSQSPSKEPLLSALGGLPFALKAHIEKELGILQDANIKPIFVLDGLHAGQAYDPFQSSLMVRSMVNEAWELYNQHRAEQAVNAFGNSGYAKPEDYYNLLISVLYKWGIDFQVAPSSARAQLAYFASLDGQFCDAVAGSSELLLFEVDKVITKLDFENSEFTFVQRRQCMEELGVTAPEIFVDACLLSGNDYIPHLPTLSDASNPRRYRILEVLHQMRLRNDTGNSLCVSLSETEPMKRYNYLERFRRARLFLKHAIILDVEGEVKIAEVDSAPGDLHFAVGKRLPMEIYAYLTKGAISSRFLNQFIEDSIDETCPVDGGDSEPYKMLVREKLWSIIITTTCLLGRTLFRGYWFLAREHKFWYDQDEKVNFKLTDYPDPNLLLDDWNVHEDVINTKVELQVDAPKIGALLSVLKDEAFAKQTRAPKDDARPLSTKLEFLANIQWRFLRLREYIDEDHKLTRWGEVLEIVADRMKNSPFEDAPLMLVELLRLNMLESDASQIQYTGAPIRGSDTDKRNCLLISRLACLGKLKHKAIGFTGPLSRHLLAYNSIISKIRVSLRDLLEMCFLTMLIRNDAEREAVDLVDVSLNLPLYFQNDCSLGIAVKHYLDELAACKDEVPTEEFKKGVREGGLEDWFAHAEDFQGDLERAFEIWDALFAGIKCASKQNLIQDLGNWESVDRWVKERA